MHGQPQYRFPEDKAHLEVEAEIKYVDHDVTSYVNVPGETKVIYHVAYPTSPKDFARIPIPMSKSAIRVCSNGFTATVMQPGGIDKIQALHPLRTGRFSGLAFVDVVRVLDLG